MGPDEPFGPQGALPLTAAAIAAAGGEVTSNKSTNVTTDGASDIKYPSVKAVKTYADSLVVGLLDDRGNYDASGNTFPASGGSGTAGAILKGDIWIISVAGTLGGSPVQIGDSVRALADTPGQTAGNWGILDSNQTLATLGALINSATSATPNDADLVTTVDTSVVKKITWTAVKAFLKTYFDTLYAGINSKIQSIIVAASDETTALTAGTGKVTFRMPYAFTLTDIRASLTTAQPSGSIFTVDVNESGTTILSTKLTIDNTEKTSTTAATPPVISDASLADDAEITVDIDQIGDSGAAGLKITLIGNRT